MENVCTLSLTIKQVPQGTIRGSDRSLNGITIKYQQQAHQETLQTHLESAPEEWEESRLCIH